MHPGWIATIIVVVGLIAYGIYLSCGGTFGLAERSGVDRFDKYDLLELTTPEPTLEDPVEK